PQLGDDLLRLVLLSRHILILLDAIRHTSSRTTSVGVDHYHWAYSPRPPILSLTLNGSGTGSTCATVYAALSATQPALTGTNYSSSFNGTQVTIDYGYAPSHSCSTLFGRATRAGFTVSMTNAKACNILTSELNFGTLTSLSTAHTATTTIGVTCTSGLAYNIGLSNGSGGGTGPTARRMTNPSTSQYVTYGTYRNAGYTLPWGATIGTNTVASSGTGLTQNFTAYGQIPAQAQPPTGQYRDTIVVTVSY
ncbi:MAG: spore coat U domain-containing protein, partial [Alphaproteobacteria bacterium]|nr:spore coat U domain-containing protein [Alphaproteobacteria bacterium]